MAMTWEQWAAIVSRINARWPDQQIEPLTAGEWYDEVAHLDPNLMLEAVRNLHRTEDFRPPLAALLREVGRLRANQPLPPSSKVRVDENTFRQILTLDPTAQNTVTGVVLSDGSCLPNQTRGEAWVKNTFEDMAS